MTTESTTQRLDRLLDFLKAHPVPREVQAYRRARIAGIIQRQWKKEELADEQRRLSVGLYQEIKDFERKTGLKVQGLRIKRNKQGIESVIVKVEMPDQPVAKEPIEIMAGDSLMDRPCAFRKAKGRKIETGEKD